MKTIIHVNAFIINGNIASGAEEPVIAIRPNWTGNGDVENIQLSNCVAIFDKEGNEVARIVYRPQDPIDMYTQPAGNGRVHCWIETEHVVKAIDDIE